MLTLHRLVGWWLAGGAVAFAVPAFAQSTASFPEDAPAATTPAAPAPPQPAAPPTTPAPVAPAPAPVVPLAPVAAPTPLPAPPLAPVAPIAPPLPGAADTRPPLLPYQHGLPVPPGYEVVKRPASGLLKGGLVGLGIAYVGGLAFGAVTGFENGTGWLAVPIIGPWGAIGARDYEQCRTSTVAEAKRCVRNAVREVQIITFFAVDGVGQLAGTLVTLAGLLSTREELIRSDLVKVEVSVLPPLRGDPWRLSVRGQF